MNRCPITYDLCQQRYCEKGLKLLSRALKNLHNFPYTADQQVQLALELTTKLSIQGIQPKLSLILNVKKEQFEVVETAGKFILKPPHKVYREVPQNEDVSMRLAKVVGIEVPLHGMIYNSDGSMSYFIKRFDRVGNRKIGVEDFSQLLGHSRETKYESSMEKIVAVIDDNCTFPKIEKVKLFRLVLFNFLIGNEDMHLKNFMLIKHGGDGEDVKLSPAFDLVNTTIILNSKEELALPLRGKKSRLTYSDFVDYFGCERLGLKKQVLEKELQNFRDVLPEWQDLLEKSFLSKEMRTLYSKLIHERLQRLNNP